MLFRPVNTTTYNIFHLIAVFGVIHPSVPISAWLWVKSSKLPLHMCSHRPSNMKKTYDRMEKELRPIGVPPIDTWRRNKKERRA